MEMIKRIKTLILKASSLCNNDDDKINEHKSKEDEDEMALLSKKL